MKQNKGNSTMERGLFNFILWKKLEHSFFYINTNYQIWKQVAATNKRIGNKFYRQSTAHAAYLRVSLITVQMCSVCWWLMYFQHMRLHVLFFALNQEAIWVTLPLELFFRLRLWAGVWACFLVMEPPPHWEFLWGVEKRKAFIEASEVRFLVPFSPALHLFLSHT